MSILVPDQGLPITPPAIAMALVDLADCVCAALENEGAGPTCWCGLYPGAQVSWDYCGECTGDVCGMGWVRLAQIFPYDAFPTATTVAKCTSPMAWAVEVGALRCFPHPQDGGLIDPASMTEVAVKQTLDAAALLSALQCCDLKMDIALAGYTPLGPTGGCVGGQWIAFIDGL